MKFAIINSVCGKGSTGRLAVEFLHTLSSNGDEGNIFFGYGKSTVQNSTKLSSSEYVKFNVLKTRLLGKHAFYSKTATRRLIHLLDTYKPDRILLEQVHGHYLNVPLLFQYFNRTNIPVFWVQHDCWAITGHCVHFSFTGCDKWKTGCYGCPQLRTYPNSLIFDRSKTSWYDKKKYFTLPKNLVLVTPSKWLESCFKESYLQNKKIICMYHGIDLNIFIPHDSEKTRLKLGISKNDFVVLGMTGKWFDKRNKQRATALINKSSQITFVLLGKAKIDVELTNKDVVFLDYIEDAKELSTIYSMADVFINLSYEDSFSLVTAEALACGTPVIGLDSTAIPEIIGDCGKLLDKNCNADAILHTINEFKNADQTKIRKLARKRAETLFDRFDNNRRLIRAMKRYK